MKRKKLTLKATSHKKEKKKNQKYFKKCNLKKERSPKKYHFWQRPAPSLLSTFIQSNNTSLVYYTFAAFNLFSYL